MEEVGLRQAGRLSRSPIYPEKLNLIVGDFWWLGSGVSVPAVRRDTLRNPGTLTKAD